MFWDGGSPRNDSLSTVENPAQIAGFFNLGVTPARVRANGSARSRRAAALLSGFTT
jgi:hypothetical protein